MTEKLSEAQLQRLCKLEEELSACLAIVYKILRFDYYSRNPGDPNSSVNSKKVNSKKLEEELGDLNNALDILFKSGDIQSFNVQKKSC